jgi:hypothetical protein
MSTTPSNLPPWWTPDLAIGSPAVNVVALNTKLAQFVVRAAAAHVLLFGSELVITSGNDGNHVPSSAHYKNAAVDLRSHDKSADQQMLFGGILAYLGSKDAVGVFDERATTSPHWHCEDASFLGG